MVNGTGVASEALTLRPTALLILRLLAEQPEGESMPLRLIADGAGLRQRGTAHYHIGHLGAQGLITRDRQVTAAGRALLATMDA